MVQDHRTAPAEFCRQSRSFLPAEPLAKRRRQLSVLDGLLRRDRAVILAALLALTALAWAYLLFLSANMAVPMPGMAMPGMEEMVMGGEAAGTPVMRDLVFAVAMWTVMMIGMMTPSAAPMILLYARVGRQAEAAGKIFASSAWFALGYFLAWAAVALAASALQVALARAGLVSAMLASTSDPFTGILLIVSGLYQWSPWKDICLSQCRSPLLFVQRHGGFRGSVKGALSLGLKHGLYCVGCCWALMAVLFVGGVMNLFWVAALSVLVLIEKVAPYGRNLARGLGLVLVAAGLIFLMRGAGM